MSRQEHAFKALYKIKLKIGAFEQSILWKFCNHVLKKQLKKVANIVQAVLQDTVLVKQSRKPRKVFLSVA